MMLSSGIHCRTILANPSESPSSCNPTKIAPGNSRTPANGAVRWGTYGAHSSKGNKSDVKSSQQSRTSDCLVDIRMT